jgi:signal transduction histidine kinase
LVFVVIAALVLGGLGWATAAALHLEQAQQASATELARSEQVRLALWRLDSRVAPSLAREDSRPYPHYSALHSPMPALNANGQVWPVGSVFVPSPLLSAELPDWMLLHFQCDPCGAWESPQVVPEGLACSLKKPPLRLSLANVTPERAALLKELAAHNSVSDLLARLHNRGVSATEVEQEPAVPPPGEAGNLANARDNNKDNWAANQPAAPPGPRGGAGPAAQSPEHEYATRNSIQKRAMQEGRQGYLENSTQQQGGGGGFGGGGLGSLAPPLAPGPGGPAVPGGALMDKPMPAPRDEQAAAEAKRAALRLAREIAPAVREPAPVLREVRIGTMVPLWLPGPEHPERLLLAREVRVADKPMVQGVVLDWQKLEGLLRAEVSDLFPEARLVPRPEGEPNHPERAMTALPLQLDPGPSPADAPPGWTPLRIGLASAWIAALVALAAVGLGGWSLLDLSERRFRFVSAVTHELRTPMTTLRLYLDLLTSGMVRDAAHRDEYLRTLQSESDRLHRLIGNVLDFARLEKGRPKLAVQEVPAAAFLDKLRGAWAERCEGSGKRLVVESALSADAVLRTDGEMVQQIVGNLIDNACKYTREAADARLWLRARTAVGGGWVLEVEDRGPGVTPRDRRQIFRPFQRGRGVEATAGGVGLGLALAERWAALLGGRLTVQPGAEGVGACFRLELPAAGA